MPRSRAVPFAVAFTLVAAALSATGGYLLTDLEPGQDIPAVCDGSSFLTPSDGGSLFSLRSEEVGDSDPAEDDILWHLYDGTSIGPGPASCDWQGPSGFANWQCFNNQFIPQPVAGQTVWGIITVYPGALPGGSHEGWIVLDSSSGADMDATRVQSPQRLRLPRDEPGGIDFPSGRVEGVVIGFEYPTEFSSTPDVDLCYLGGNTDQTGFDGRVIAGFNLYRLPAALIDPADSRPEHYLCGPDLDCARAADNGWVAFIPLDPRVAGCGVDDAPCQSDDPLRWPYEIVDLPGTQNVDVRYVDQPPDPGAEYAWVVQPVLRVNDIGNLTDWHAMAALDLDGDGLPEFVDPGRNGLGLTANGLTVPSGNGGGSTLDLPIILVTADSEEGPCPPLTFDSGITVTALGDCEMDVSWQPASGGRGGIVYDLYRDTASPVALDPAHLLAADLTSTNYLDSVAWGNDYAYRVVARDHCANPGPQEEPNAGGDSPLTGPLPIIFDSDLTVTPGDDCDLLVEWDPASSGRARVVYDVYRGLGSPVALDPANLVAADLTDTSYLDPVTWGPYFYRVVARDRCSDPGPQEEPNGGGDSDPENPIDETPPEFGGITDTEDAGFCNVLVHWDESTAVDACSGVALYTIYRDHGVAHRGETLVGTSPHTPYQDTTPGNGVWVYVVRAVDAAGNEEQNEVFVQESEGSCTNNFPMDAGMKKGKNIDPPNADKQSGILRVGREPEGPPPPGFDSEWLDIRISWEASPNEGGLYPVTYAILRGSLEDLQTDGYLYTLVDPAACGIVENEYIMEDQVDGFSYYYVIVPVSGDNATFGYDSRGVERPAAPVCE